MVRRILADVATLFGALIAVLGCIPIFELMGFVGSSHFTVISPQIGVLGAGLFAIGFIFRLCFWFDDR
jgi:hypothetical protein